MGPNSTSRPGSKHELSGVKPDMRTAGKEASSTGSESNWSKSGESQGSNSPDGRIRVGLGGPFSKPSRCPVPPKLYRIGEVVNYSGLSRQTIHNYTTMGLLRECSWTPGGHRLYDESVFERLYEIAEFKSQRKSMEFIREYFEAQDAH